MTSSTSELSPNTRIGLAIAIGIVLMLHGCWKSRSDPLFEALKDHGVKSFCAPSFEEKTMEVGRRLQIKNRTFLECTYESNRGPITRRFEVHFDVRALERQVELADGLSQSTLFQQAAEHLKVRPRAQVEAALANYAAMLTVTYLPEDPWQSVLGNVETPPPNLFNFTFVLGVVFVGLGLIQATSRKSEGD